MRVGSCCVRSVSGGPVGSEYTDVSCGGPEGEFREDPQAREVILAVYEGRAPAGRDDAKHAADLMLGGRNTG